MANGQWLKAVKDLRSPKAPQNLLVNQTIFLRAEAWECGACATTDDWFAYVVTALGYNLKNVYLWSSVAQNIFLHNVFEFYLIFVIARLEKPWQSIKKLMAKANG